MTFQKPIPVHKPLQTERLRERGEEGKKMERICVSGVQREGTGM